MLAKITRDLREAHAMLTARLTPGMIAPEARTLGAFPSMPQVSPEFVTHEVSVQTFHDALRLTCEAARAVGTHLALLVDNLDGLSASGGEASKCTWLPDWRISVIGQDEDHWRTPTPRSAPRRRWPSTRPPTRGPPSRRPPRGRASWPRGRRTFSPTCGPS